MNEEKDIVVFNPTVILDGSGDDIHGNTDPKDSVPQGSDWE